MRFVALEVQADHRSYTSDRSEGRIERVYGDNVWAAVFHGAEGDRLASHDAARFVTVSNEKGLIVPYALCIDGRAALLEQSIDRRYRHSELVWLGACHD